MSMTNRYEEQVKQWEQNSKAALQRARDRDLTGQDEENFNED